MLLRLLDIFLSIVALVLSAPVLVVGVAMSWFDTGSPFFCQIRIGRFGSEFNIWKLRTLPVSARRDVATHDLVLTNVSAVGRFLRTWKIDELPQLFQVLVGEMSLVGPRPCLPSQKDLIAQRRRHGIFEVRPGLTGLAQIKSIDMRDSKALVGVDKLFIKSHGLKTYLNILLATVIYLVRRFHHAT